MVGIWLYRGKLQERRRGEDIRGGRRYACPQPTICLKDFKRLLSRRNKALLLLLSSIITTHTPLLNHHHQNNNNNNNNNNVLKRIEDQNKINVKLVPHHGTDCGDDGEKIKDSDSDMKEPKIEDGELVRSPVVENPLKGTDSGDDGEKIDGSDSIMEVEKIEEGELVRSSVVEKPPEYEKGMDVGQMGGTDSGLELTTIASGEVVGSLIEEKPLELTDVEHVPSDTEKLTKDLEEKPTDVVVPSDTEKKKKEIEEKLEVLNAKKHDLVQVLKQILNAEEELKKRNSTQGMGMRPSIPLQVDVTTDSGSLSRLTTPRLNSDGNLASDIERGETDETPHHSTPSRHLVRTSSVSPSSDSLHKRPVFSAVPHPRASLGGVGSPSRFAPIGHPTNLPTAVSTSGASYIASSPSPAASGGTSAFRESRQPSPWN